MFAARKSLGRLHFADHILGYLETAVRHSFEARRGKLYNACRALNAMLVVDLAKQATEQDFTRRELEELAWNSLETQMEPELKEQFRFAYLCGMARRRYTDLNGVMTALEQLVPAFAEEFSTREAAGTLDRKGGFLRWATGTQEVGSVEDLLSFCNASLFFAESVLDDASEFEHLNKRARDLQDMLPQ